MKKRKRRNLRVERWKRAIELAKILFEDQGYRSLYLDDLRAFALGAASEQDADATSETSIAKTPKRRRNPRCT
jgi:hypothetical protein